MVRVDFDPRVTSRSLLDGYANTEGFSPLQNTRFQVDGEPQFYLRKHAARHLPLTQVQRTQINLAVPYRTPLADILSPQQCAWLADPRLHQAGGDEAYREDIRQSWSLLAAQLGMIERTAGGRDAH